jgi:hypothetical protein
MEGAELTNVIYTHSGVGIHHETSLNIDLEINNKREDFKIGKVCVWGCCGGRS